MGWVHSRLRSALAALIAGSLLVIAGCGSGSPSSQQPPPPPPTVPLTRLSVDTFTNAGSQHATEVEASTAAFGSTIVSAFQVGRIFGGGASDIGFATSTDSGATWSNGFLPGTTIFAGGPFAAISDPVVAFDAAHGVWMISTLPIALTESVAVSRSTDGMTWQNPIVISVTPSADKNWIACDNTPSSPFFGHCYMQWDDPSPAANGLIWMSTSVDGGLTWAPALNTTDLARGIGGQPVVQPNGTVVVPIESWTGTTMLAFTSTDGGASWNSSVTLATISDHLVAGNLRTSALPSATVDGGGTVYAVWQDCRFRAGCTSNDLVMSTSSDMTTWTTPLRIPIDAVGSLADHFIPGLAADPATSGSTAHLALTYHFYLNAACASTSCSLNAGFISSQDGGASWSAPTTLAGPMKPSWLPNTFAGLMVGDYTSTAFSGGKAFGVFALARANVGSVFDEPIYTTTSGFTVSEFSGVLSSRGERPIPGARSDHPARTYYDLENRYPITLPPN